MACYSVLPHSEMDMKIPFLSQIDRVGKSHYNMHTIIICLNYFTFFLSFRETFGCRGFNVVLFGHHCVIVSISSVFYTICTHVQAVVLSDIFILSPPPPPPLHSFVPVQATSSLKCTIQLFFTVENAPVCPIYWVRIWL